MCVRRLLGCRSKPLDPKRQYAFEFRRLPAPIVGMILHFVYTENLFRLSHTNQYLRGRVWSHVAALRVVAIPWRPPSSGLLAGYVAMVRAMRALQHIRCIPDPKQERPWQNRRMMWILAAAIRINLKSIARVDLPWPPTAGDAMECPETATMSEALAQCPRLSRWSSHTGQSLSTVRHAAFNCTELEHVTLANASQLQMLSASMPNPQRVSYLAVAGPLVFRASLSQFSGLQTLSVTIMHSADMARAFGTVWARLARLESLNLRFKDNLFGGHRPPIAPDALIKWAFPALRRLALDATQDDPVPMMETPRLEFLDLTSTMAQFHAGSILQSAAKTLIGVARKSSHSHPSATAPYALLRDGLRFDGLRTLRLEACCIDDWTGLARQLPALTRLCVCHAAVRLDGVRRFMRETADRLEWLEIANTWTALEEYKEYKEALVAVADPKSVVMRALVFGCVPIAVLDSGSDAFEFPAIVQLTTEDASCGCVPTVRWTAACPTIGRCDAHRVGAVFSGIPTHQLRMTRLCSVPIETVSTSVEWRHDDCDGELAFDGSLPGHCYAGTAPLLVRHTRSMVDVWDVRFVMGPYFRLNHSSILWGRRAKIIHLIGDDHCRIGHGITETAHAPGAESVIQQLRAAYDVRNRIQSSPFVPPF